MRIVREAAPDKVLRVDANAAWTPKHALRMIAVLAELGVEFVEQPLPRARRRGAAVRARARRRCRSSPTRSCVVATDIPRLVGAVDGINIKLAKCGGLREALRMIATARAHGMLVMCGLHDRDELLGITAAAHLAPLLDYADLDGAALVANDPYVGATIEGGEIALPDGPGLGVELR